MTSPRPSKSLMTPEEYLAFEETARGRHEYVGGHVYAMSGGTVRHMRVIGNVFALLREAAAGGPCETFFQTLKVRAAEDVFYYPDVFVACGALDDDDVFVTTPCVVVEVLSPSTKGVDRREKLTSYRRIPALRAYLIVETTRQEVERHWRDTSGAWRSEVVTPAESGGRVAVPCPEAVLTLDEIYAGVTVRPRPRRVRERAPA